MWRKLFLKGKHPENEISLLMYKNGKECEYYLQKRGITTNIGK